VSDERGPRIVLLGASNVARSLSPLVATARNVLEVEGACDVFTAIGRGRSYGAWSKLFGRSLCGILQSGIWSALDRVSDHGRPPFALLTDIGNDIMYEHSPRLIVQWIRECLDRLTAHDSRIVMTALPMARIRRIKPRQFTQLRNLLFPRSTLTFDDLLTRGEDVMKALETIGRDRDIPLVEQPDDWYGVDPIHVRFRHYPRSWRAILSQWRPGRAIGDIPLARSSMLRWLRLARAVPQEFRICGVNFGRTQPAARLPDGTQVWCY
jgi:hypothetical protein